MQFICLKIIFDPCSMELRFYPSREFLTDCLFSTQVNQKPYELPWQQKTTWSLLFGAMLIVAITGNCIVLWIVLGNDFTF